MGDIQRYDSQWPAALHDDLRRIRVFKNIELGTWRGIAAFSHGTTHQNDFPDLRQDIRLPGHGFPDIGQWAGRHKRDAVVFCSKQGFDDEINRMLFLQGHGGLVDSNAIDTRFTMYIFCCNQFVPHGFVTAGKNRYIGPVCQFAHNTCVTLG